MTITMIKTDMKAKNNNYYDNQVIIILKITIKKDTINVCVMLRSQALNDKRLNSMYVYDTLIL